MPSIPARKLHGIRSKIIVLGKSIIHERLLFMAGEEHMKQKFKVLLLLSATLMIAQICSAQSDDQEQVWLPPSWIFGSGYTPYDYSGFWGSGYDSFYYYGYQGKTYYPYRYSNYYSPAGTWYPSRYSYWYPYNYYSIYRWYR